MYTVICGCTSNFALLTCGVPQGGILGPLSFLVYITDLPKLAQFKATMLADDTTLQQFGNDLVKMEIETSQMLKKLSTYFEI